MTYMSAAESSGAAFERVMAKVEESGRPWTPDTAVLLFIGFRGDETIHVGTASEIADRIREAVQETVGDKRQSDSKRRGAKKALALVEKFMPLKNKDCVRWVTHGRGGDWYSFPQKPRKARP